MIVTRAGGTGIVRGATGIGFMTDDVVAAHADLVEGGVEVDEILPWPGTLPMFGFHDPDGNAFSITALAL